ncbi:hypothetical protein Tco_1157476 [Tanacetum coccineum]
MCRTLTDQLAPPALFSQLRAMEYDQLYTEFNVGATRQTCLGAEVRIRAKHTLRKKKILEEECARQTNLLKEKDAEIASLKSHLSLKEAEAAEAIRLRNHVPLLKREILLLKPRCVLSKKRLRFWSLKRVSSLETTCAELRNQVVGYELFKEQIEAVQDEQVRVLTEKIAEVDANLMGMALQLDDEFYPSYLTTIVGRRWILSPGIEHGKAGRALTDVAAYNPSAIADIMDSLRLEGPAAETPDAGDLQPSHEQLMLPIHRPEDNVVLGETSLYFSLEVIHNRIQRIRGDAEARRLSLSDAMVPLIEPFSSENLLGEASTSGVPVTADVVTTLSTTFAQSVSVLVPPLLVADYRVVHWATVEPAAMAVLSTLAWEGCLHFMDVTSLKVTDVLSSQKEFSIAVPELVSWLEARVADFEVVVFFYFALLLASRIAACSLLSSKRSRLISMDSSFCSMSISAVLKVGMPISAGMTAFVPYDMWDFFTQSLLLSSSRAFIPSPKLLFALSTKPLACGCLTEAKRCRMHSFSHQSLNGLSLNCFPLSVIISPGFLAWGGEPGNLDIP